MAGETPALHGSQHAEPARRPRSMTLDTLADVMRSGCQSEVVETDSYAVVADNG